MTKITQFSTGTFAGNPDFLSNQEDFVFDSRNFLIQALMLRKGEGFWECR
ncbi:MAG: hypothetical protein ACTSYI_03010 [Promethearchaeota archaeon]